jgi:hypothetical protein
LDAYSGYNQIKLKKEDEEKMAFITPYGVFCYQVMPFGLKNAGATYQRMMQSCLGSQIGCNIQVYIDDVVITTREEKSLISDLAETFDNLSRVPGISMRNRGEPREDSSNFDNGETHETTRRTETCRTRRGTKSLRCSPRGEGASFLCTYEEVR